MNEILLVNPRRRRKGRKSKARGRVRLKRHASRRRRVHRVKARRYKRNPSGRSFSLRSIGSAIVPTVKAGAMGAVGALANDALIGQVSKLSFLPDVLKSGYGRHALKIGSAVAVGAIGGMVLKGKGQALAVGAATVAMHDLLKEVIFANLPSVGAYLGDYTADGFEGYGAVNPGSLVDDSSMGTYIDGQIGAYVPGMVGGDDDM